MRTLSHWLVMAVILAQAVLFDKLHLFEHRQRAIHSRQADVRILSLDAVVKRLSIEVSVATLQHLKNQSTLRGQPPARCVEDSSQLIS
jgi:hypothetical protein